MEVVCTLGALEGLVSILVRSKTPARFFGCINHCAAATRVSRNIRELGQAIANIHDALRVEYVERWFVGEVRAGQGHWINDMKPKLGFAR